jgi:hypothetical protein
MIKKYSLVFIALLCFVVSSYGQIDISTHNSDFITNFNGWNGSLPNGFSHIGENVSYRGTSSTLNTGGLYAVNNSGYGYQPAGSADNLTLTGQFRNTTGTTITGLEISYDAFNINYATSRLPGWNVTTALGNVTSLNWSYNQTSTNVSPDTMTLMLTGLNITNNSTFTIDFASDRGSGSGSSPKIGLNNITIKSISGATTYSVTYDGNLSTGGTAPIDNTAYNSGDSVTVLGNTGTLTKTCNTFNNWNTTANGSGTAYSAGNTFNITANTTLYAQWNSTNKTVTFNNNGGAGAMTPQAACSTTNLNANTFTKIGFVFDTWNTRVDNTGTDYGDGATYDFYTDVTLYAQWIPIPSCSELMISEYVEGSSNNKYIEIYNPTASIVNLTGYSLVLFANGTTTPTSTENLSGSIAGYGTVVYANSSAAAYSGTTITSAVCNFNGDDAIALFNGANYIDIIGSVGHDPGSAWTADGGYSTQNKTLRRKSTIQNGITINPATGFPTLVSEWDLLNIDDVSDLGNHTSDCQASTPEIQLVDNTATNQNCGFTIDFGTQALSSNTDLTFDIENVGSADLDISSFGITGDYTIVSPAAPLTITSGNAQTVTVRFAPTANGTRSGVLTINNNDSNEGSCTVDLTGEGFTPAPEIRVERNTNALIPDGSAANIGYNTIFGQQPIGSTSASKTYYISNELGTADLIVSSITFTGAGTDFSFVGLPSLPLTIPPGDGNIVPFQIEFNPVNTTGVKNDTVQIINTDSDETTYTFGVQGTSICAATSITLMPSSGPEGTVVTITGDDLIPLPTIVLNGDTLTPISISATQVSVVIPVGADTGNIELTDFNGCQAFAPFTVITNDSTSCEGNTGSIPSGWTDLMISGVFDNDGGSCHYLELFNPTNTGIDLSTYSLRLSNNQATANAPLTWNVGAAQPLAGTIAPYSTFMISFKAPGDDCENCPNIIPDYVIEQSAFGINGLLDPNNGSFKGVDRVVLLNGTTPLDMVANSEYDDAGFVYTRDLTATAPNTFYTNTDWQSQGVADCFGFQLTTFSSKPTVSTIVTTSSCNTTSLSVSSTEGYNGTTPADTMQLDFEWYYFNNITDTWTLITTGGDFTVTNTIDGSAGIGVSYLDIDNIDNKIDYQFYCKVRESGATCYQASNATKLTVQSSIWYDNSGTLEWSNGAPDSSTIAVIDANYITNTNGDIEACNLIVNPNYTLTVSNSTYVNVVNNVINHGAISIQTHGSFVQQGDGVSAGTFVNSGAGIANLGKTTAVFDSRISEINYTYWSSPVNDQSNSGFGEDISTVFPMPIGNRRYYFMAQNYMDTYFESGNNNDNSTLGQDDIDDNGNDWQNASGAMEIGRGYAVTTAPPAFSGPYSDASTVFSGALNTGDITITLYKNNNEVDDNNWNFIGNPYPSAISVDDFFSANIADVPLNPSVGILTEGAIFLWSQSVPPDSGNNGNENVNFAQSDYAIINRAAATAGTSGIVPSRFIPSGQGFFVALTENLGAPVNSVTSSNVVFTNRMRRTLENTQFFEANDDSQDNKTTDSNNTYEKNILWLNLTSDNGVFSQIAIAYVNGATDGNDGWSYDTPRNLSTGTFAALYSIIDSSDRQFGIQGKSLESLSLDENIPLGFDTSINIATLYKFSIAQLEGSFLSQNDIFIKDNMFNKIHNLKTSDYSFTSEVGEFNNRFEIVFTEAALSLGEVKIDSNTLQIIELQNGDVQFKVSSQFEMKSIEIVDLLGRTLYKLEAQGNSQTFSLSNLSQATYLAKVELSNGYVITKKALKRK